MDEGDYASAQEQQLRDLQLRVRKPVTIKPNNNCHNCDDDVADGVLFCSTECRDDYDRRERAKGRNGN